MHKHVIAFILFAMLWGIKIAMDNNGKKESKKESKKTVKYILTQIAIAALFIIVAGYVWQTNLL